MSNTYIYNFTADGYTGTLTVTTSSTLTNVDGSQGYAVTSITGSFDGQTITGEYGSGGGVASIADSSSLGFAAGDMYDNTIFINSSNGSSGVSHYGIDDDGIAFISSSGEVYDLYPSFGVRFHFDDYYDATLLATLNSTEAPCYAAGTRILTSHGEVPVEALQVGDHVVTAFGQTQPIKWIGHRRTDCRRHPQPDRVWPVCIQAGAFGEGLPKRDLFLSPDHAVFAEGVLIPVKHLINGATIVQTPRNRVSYYHLELDSHDVILAEGLPCESYLDNGTSSAFDNGGVVQLHPEFSPAERCEAIGEAAACAPLRIEGEAFTRVDTALRRRAVTLGYQPNEATPRPAAPAVISIDLNDLLRPNWYLANNPDVAAAGIDAHVHYVSAGRREGRLPCPEADLLAGLGLIDPATVVRTMPDVVTAGADLPGHFCAHGWREGRRPNAYFDPAWYRATHDVPEGMNPLTHYVLFGENQGLAPSRHFDPAWYRQRYGVAPSVCALAHYLQHRRTQRFSPLPSFDAAAYAQAQQASLRPGRDPYLHALASRSFANDAERRDAA